ncbi:unnamed protein product [Symbiodinium natans]|uniref:Ubiquitin-like domain-containing protein n=1 Tax=Symbiodinium natans TaxID=878477 RepID=A0A812J4K8_9DINO|nr:unnamed protein product [Symbiodinium natans]
MSSSGATGGILKVALLSGRQTEVPFAASDTLRSLGPAILSQLELEPMVVFHPTPLRYLRGTEQLQPDQLVTALDLHPGEVLTVIASTNKKEIYAMTFKICFKFTDDVVLRARLALSEAYSFSLEMLGRVDGNEVDCEIHGTWSVELKDQDPQREAVVLRPFGAQLGMPFYFAHNIASAASSLPRRFGGGMRKPVGLPISWFQHPGPLHWKAGPKDNGDAVVRLLDPDAPMRTLRQVVEEERSQSVERLGAAMARLRAARTH